MEVPSPRRPYCHLRQPHGKPALHLGYAPEIMAVPFATLTNHYVDAQRLSFPYWFPPRSRSADFVCGIANYADAFVPFSIFIMS
jgi:hypothetical protein